jgi:hypothetical protein
MFLLYIFSCLQYYIANFCPQAAGMAFISSSPDLVHGERGLPWLPSMMFIDRVGGWNVATNACYGTMERVRSAY